MALNRSVGAVDWTVSNPANPFPTKYYWTGTRSSVYIMLNPTITYGHINSIYVKTETDYFTPLNQLEFGWWW